MRASRGRRSQADAAADHVGDGPVDETPDLNVHEVNAERTVLTEPGNTDGWIATDLTVAPPE